MGHRVSSAGVVPQQKKVEAIFVHPRPGSLQELQGFLGTVNFYHRFLPAAAKLLRPLTDALRGGKAIKERVNRDGRGLLSNQGGLGQSRPAGPPQPWS
jgi:hypothetical protein